MTAIVPGRMTETEREEQKEMTDSHVAAIRLDLQAEATKIKELVDELVGVTTDNDLVVSAINTGRSIQQHLGRIDNEIGNSLGIDPAAEEA